MGLDVNKYSGVRKLSREAGNLFEPAIPPRTIQSWYEKGLINPLVTTTGTGTKNKYGFLNLIEIGIIKYLTEQTIKLNTIKTVLDFLRGKGPGIITMGENIPGGVEIRDGHFRFTGPKFDSSHSDKLREKVEHEMSTTRLELLLENEEGYLVLHFCSGCELHSGTIIPIQMNAEMREDKKFCMTLMNIVLNNATEKTLIINVGKISMEVSQKLGV